MIIKTYYIDDLKKQGLVKEVPLWWHDRGLSYTASGYGRKIPTRHMVKLPGTNRWRRVYCCIFSNSGTCYVPHHTKDPETRRPNWTVIS